MTTTETKVEPIRRSAEVACSIEHAFSVFTERLATWWPLGTHSVAAHMEGDAVTAQDAVLEGRLGGRLYERMSDGREAPWGTVSGWEPPHRLEIQWQPNPESPAQTEIEVTFTALGPRQTRVELEHRGWERLGAIAREARDDYAGGWPTVFAAYVEAAGA